MLGCAGLRDSSTCTSFVGGALVVMDDEERREPVGLNGMFVVDLLVAELTVASHILGFYFDSCIVSDLVGSMLNVDPRGVCKLIEWTPMWFVSQPSPCWIGKNDGKRRCVW